MSLDHRVVMTVVCALAGTLGIAVFGIIALAFTGHDIPEVLANIATGALGALGAILAVVRMSATPVTVENASSDPVPTVEARKRPPRARPDHST